MQIMSLSFLIARSLECSLKFDELLGKSDDENAMVAIT